MKFADIVSKQIEADRRHGFNLDFSHDHDRLAQLEKDLIGLVGEVGEFANMLKKVRLAVTHAGYDGPDLEAASGHLRAELADSAIYILRLSVLLRGDLEADILAKMALNDERYDKLG